jgi:PAS domain-containing protein
MGLSKIFNALMRQRRHGERIESADARVFIEDKEHQVLDWSESGFRISGYDGAPDKGTRFAFRFALPLTDEDVFEFEAWAEVVGNDGRGLATCILHIDNALSTRLHEVMRVLATMDVRVPSGPITYD